jgi:hypothetical protein
MSGAAIAVAVAGLALGATLAVLARRRSLNRLDDKDWRR